MSIDIKLHKKDLPDDFKVSNTIAIDCEMGGLNLNRDPLFRETMKDFTERRNLNVMYPTTGTFAKGGLANLTTTVAPQSGPNSKGLESLRKYATKTY